MQNHKVVAFIGHHSPFGMNTLKCLLNSNLKPSLIVLATENRWEIFKSNLLNTKVQTGFKYKLQSIKQEIRYKLYFKKIVGDKLQGVKIIKIEDVNDKKFHEKISKFKPTLCIGAAFPQIFGRDILDLVEIVNLHPSLLPAYRGAHPHFWAIYNGEKMSGISAHKMVEKIDKGEVLAQVQIPIDGVYYSEFYNRIIDELPKLISLLSDVLLLNRKPVLYNIGIKESYFRNDQKDTCRLNFIEDDIDLILNKIRTEKAYFLLKDREVSISIAEKWTGDNSTSSLGDCFISENDFIINCNGGFLKLNKVFIEGVEIYPNEFLKDKTELNLID